MTAEGVGSGASHPNPLGTERITKLIFKYSMPAIISGVVGAVYNMVDQIFIGWGIGELGIAATNIAFPFTTVCLALALLFGTGGAARMSLSLGKGDPEQARAFAGSSLGMLAISGIIIGAVSLIFLEPLLLLFGTTDTVMIYAKPYSLIIAYGFPFHIFSMGASNILRADGNPGASMICTTSGAVFNLIADPLFMFGCGMGIEGIALATTLGQVLSTLLALYFLLFKSKVVKFKARYFKIKPFMIAATCALGMSGCVSQIAMTVVQIVTNNQLKNYGAVSSFGSDIPLAVVGAVTKLTMLFIIVIFSVGQGCQPIMGYNYGAKNYGRVIDTYKKAALFLCMYTLIVFLCLEIFPVPMLRIFGAESDAFFQFGARYTRIHMMMMLINCIQVFSTMLFTSIGKAFVGLILTLVRQSLFLIPLLYVLPIFIGLDGVLFAAPIADVLSFILAVVFIIREFRNITMLRNAMPVSHLGVL